MAALRVAISQDLLTAFAAAPRAQQKKISAFISKFRNNPLASGINYETINDAANPQYRSVRIDQDYRGIVLKPERGDVYVFLWVAKHDDAYAWARRHKSAVNPDTGSLQVYEVVHDARTAGDEPDVAIGSAVPLLPYRPRELRRLGVPEDRVERVCALTSQQELDHLQGQLPVEAFEALSFLAAGVPLDEVMQEYAVPAGVKVDTGDVAAALQNPHSQRRFHVVGDDMELQQMLEAPLEQWRVFLHPSQRELVERRWNGPVRVLGGAGTGKTVVAMHRARWLARNALGEGERLLFTTFTRNLAGDIEANLRTICSVAEMKRIEVTSIDAWVHRFMKREKQPGRIVYPHQDAFEKCWQRGLALADPELGLPDSFYEEEWRRIVLPQRVCDRRDYFTASRIGRGTPLSRKQRARIWPVFEEVRLQLHQAGLLTVEDAMFQAQDLLNQGAVARPYRAAVVDEAQDLGPEAMKLIRALVPEAENDLMIVGDAHQRIYGRRSSLGSCGIDIRGRGRKLRVNYRTTEQVSRFATAVLEGIEVDDLDDGHDPIKGYRSLRKGQVPMLKGFDDARAESQWVSNEIGRLVAAGVPSQDICVVARTKTGFKQIRAVLDAEDAGTRIIDADTVDNPSLAGVRFANMHRVKGLEFKIVFLVGVCEGTVPLAAAIRTQDPIELRAKDLNERALLHVAATRAVQSLYVTWYGQPSSYLRVISRP